MKAARRFLELIRIDDFRSGRFNLFEKEKVSHVRRLKLKHIKPDFNNFRCQLNAINL
jgi:protein tyrosine/serine phosphatase